MTKTIILPLPADLKGRARMLRRGYDAYDNHSGAVYCADCQALTPMVHTMACPKPNVKKSAVNGVSW